MKLKKWLLGLVTFAAMAVLCAVCAGAETYGHLEYSVLDDGTVQITDCEYGAEAVVIPDTIDGKSVTSIDWYAFYGCENLKSITIPNSVTSIGDNAFNGCTSLTSITIPDGVVSIGWYAFRGCSSLTSITIPNSVTSIGDSAFEGCTSLTSITIPSSVTSIGDGAFYNCSSLTEIKVASENSNYVSVNGVLYNKDKTTIICYPAGKKGNNYKIPDGVTSIGGYAFNDCTSLTSITIPDGVVSIGDGAFSNCSSLTEIKVASENSNYVSVNGVLYNKDKTTIICYPAGKKGNNYKIPDSVVSIGWYAFRGCSSLTSITIPDGVTSIGGCAFEGCSNLTSITIPNGVTSIGDGAFFNCSSLTSITIPDGVTSIGYCAFYGCSSLTSITIPDSVTSIGKCAFYGCTSLTSITIPDSVTSIGKYAFYGCTSLTSITIPNSVTEIGWSAFQGCTSLTSITIPDGVTSIGGDAFRGCSSLTSITIPNGVTSIGGDAFRGCSSLTSITIPDSVTWIYGSAFSGCTSLKSITIPNSVTSIGDGAFSECSSLTSITIPDGVVSISEFAFYRCTSLTSITIPNSVTSIDRYAFSDCSSLTSITIPNSVTEIGYSVFEGCTSLTSITIPNSVTEIGYYAFYDCTSLTSITIPNSVTSIGGSAFSGCTSLTSITIPNSVTSIGKYAFGYYNDNGYKKIDNFKIYCYSGTAGERYAKENGFEYELLDHTEHTYGEWKITKAATCTAEGTQTRTCSVCKKVETQTIKALGHKYSTTWTTDKAATCGAAGSKSHHCTRCGAKKDVTAIPATGKHDFNDWKTTKAATYTATGTKTRTCKVCKKTETATIAKLTLAKIGGFKVKAKDSTSITLQWNKNANASGYIIEAYNGKTWSQVTKITKNSTLTYKVTKLSANKTYQYRIKAYKTEGKATAYSANSATLSVNTNPTNISGFKAKSKSYNSITLQWNKNTSATGYELQKWDGKKWVSLTKISKNSTTTYTIKSLKSSTTYKYKIRAYKTIGKATQYSAYSATLSVNTNPSNMSGFKAKSKSYNSITLQWNKNTSATGYELQKWDGKKWVTLTKISKNSTTTYTVKSLKASTNYKYRIRAYKTIGKATQYSGYKELSVNTNPSNMSGFKAKSKSYNSITLQWNKNASATGYELQKWDGKKWVTLTKINKNSTTTYTVKSLKASTTYKYRIRAYKTIGKTTQYSAYSATLSVNTNPSNMSGFKAKTKTATSVTLQWNKNTSATGYEIQKWNGKKWVSAAKVTKNSTVTSTVKSLKANTSYKFRIRAYKTIGKATQYSSWSGTLTVKTKK